jgi:hypothetical protein
MSMFCVVNESRLAELASALALPQWTVEGLAIEYLDCRRFFQDGHLVQFDFGMLEPTDFDSLTHPVVILQNCVLVHNVTKSVVSQRFLRGLVGGPIVPIEQSNVLLPNGKVSPHCLPFQANAIDATDMKLGISPYAPVIDGADIFQWKLMCDPGEGPPQAPGTWFSSPVLSTSAMRAMKDIHDDIYQCFQEPPPETLREAKILRARLHRLYSELERVRQVLREEVIAYHNVNKESAESLSGYTEEDPLTITVFDEPQLGESNLRVRSFVEPLFFRSAYRARQRALEASERAAQDADAAFWITEEVEASAESITLSAMCLEAYINGVMQERLPSVSADLEGMEIRAKWLATPLMLGHADCFDKGAMPFQAFTELVKWRNQLVHYKRSFDLPVEQGGRRISKLHGICNAANAGQAVNTVERMVQRLCSRLGVGEPRWLTNHAGWLNVIPFSNSAAPPPPPVDPPSVGHSASSC